MRAAHLALTNNMSMSTSAKLPSEAMKQATIPEVLKIAHINICSLRNKVREINNSPLLSQSHSERRIVRGSARTLALLNTRYYTN